MRGEGEYKACAIEVWVCGRPVGLQELGLGGLDFWEELFVEGDGISVANGC